MLHLEAFDWNCPQHITPRFTEAELDTILAPVRLRIERWRQRKHRCGRGLRGRGNVDGAEADGQTSV